MSTKYHHAYVGHCGWEGVGTPNHHVFIGHLGLGIAEAEVSMLILVAMDVNWLHEEGVS